MLGKKFEPVSSNSYRTVFNTSFNYGFGTPKSDTCSVCDLGINEEHKAAAAKAFSVQKLDRELAKKTDDMFFVTFDLQQTLPLPRLTTNVAFYLRQLWMYNLGIHVEGKNYTKPFFNIWTEADGRRGSSEIASCLFQWVDQMNFVSPTKLIFWSDSCSGQNKNMFILALWQLLIKSNKILSIEHKFPIPGHSYLDSDRDFGHVEQALRKKENIYTVDEYHSILASSQKRVLPVVSRMAGKLLDFKQLPNYLQLTNPVRNESGDPINLRDKVRWVKVTKFGQYEYKHSFEDNEDWKIVKMLKTEEAVENFDPRTVLQQCHGHISSAKLADIKKLLMYVPDVYKDFYLSLKSNDDSDVESSETPNGANESATERKRRTGITTVLHTVRL